MTTVPVFWVSRHDEILARGYADQGLAEAIFDRTLWRPPAALTFEHLEVRGDFPEVDGAVVVLPARHHASAEDVQWFRRQLDHMKWSLVILAGDEEWTFPWRQIRETPTRRVYVMQPIPAQAHLSGKLPGGWYPGTREGISAAGDVPGRWTQGSAPMPHRDWFFAGQVTHARRKECADVLRGMDGAEPNRGALYETAGYLQGMPQLDYWLNVANAKVIPCPSGPMTVDTARAFEAMEAGCVPVLDTRTPRGDDYDYWTLLFGEGHPFPTIVEWSDFPEMLERILADWTNISNRCFAFWQGYKRRLAHQLDDDIRAVSHQPIPGRESPTPNPDDLITAIVLTSPTPGDPSTDNIVTTIDSIRAQLPLAEIVVVCDGVRPEQAAMADDYAEYVRRLLWQCNFRWRNVVPVVQPEFGHQGNSLRAGLALVTTPQILFMEHDTPLDGPIDWEGLTAFVATGAANMVRFHHEKVILDPHKPLMIDQVPQHFRHHVEARDSAHVPYETHVPLMRSVQFWARPHLASTAFYRDQVMPYFGRASRTMIEDLMYSVVTSAYKDRGVAGWDEWRIWTYAPSELGHMQRSTHLDSRGDAPKFEMVYAYDGEPPAGAPFPTKVAQ